MKEIYDEETMTEVLTIRFANEIRVGEVALFRGAVINALDEKLLLFHDHEGEGLRYSYPLIQYKRIGGRAAIVCIGKGVEDIGAFLSAGNYDMKLGDRAIEAEIVDIRPRKYSVQKWDRMFEYRIRRWLPFNSVNYKKYRETEGAAARIMLLEQILTGNILSMAKGMAYGLMGR